MKCTKLIHKTQGRARTVAKGMSIKSGEPFDSYYCKICEGWHVGHSSKKQIAVLKKALLENNSAALGIDPGKTGAMALVCGKYLEIHDFKNTLASQKALSVLKSKFSIKFCILEKVWLRAEERDVKKAETLIRNAQMWEDLLILNGIDYEKYAPETWRAGLVKKNMQGRKQAYVKKAREIFKEYPAWQFNRPGRAEAALIAWRAWRHVSAGWETEKKTA